MGESFRSVGFAPMCEWLSIIPGITSLPAASMMRAPAGVRTDVPMAVILPFSIKIEPLRIGTPDAV